MAKVPTPATELRPGMLVPTPRVVSRVSFEADGTVVVEYEGDFPAEAFNPTDSVLVQVKDSDPKAN